MKVLMYYTFFTSEAFVSESIVLIRETDKHFPSTTELADSGSHSDGGGGVIQI